MVGLTAPLVVILQVFACLGLGGLLLRLLRLDRDLSFLEHLGLAFAVGLGLLGWLVFPLGVGGGLEEPWLLGLLFLAALCNLAARRPAPAAVERLDAMAWCLIALIFAVLFLDLAEGLSPPADADSLAYQFTIPKQFLGAGRIGFIPRPLDGAVPLLVQATYIPVLGLGGERALTLWTMISGWAASLLVFAIARNHLGRNWSLAVALVFLTTPAVIYGAGAGQVEVRLALFALTAAWAAAKANGTGRLSYAVLAGLCVGFYAGGKYLGLLFAIAVGITMLWHRRWPALSIAFGLAALAAGFQWYGWNWLHTGDPFFPTFFQSLGNDDLAEWTKAHDAKYKEWFFEIERGVPRTFLWFFLYPFKTMLDPLPVFEAGRVGLGPYGLLILPFAGLGVWKYRHRVLSSPLFIFALISAAFYALLFIAGPSQRVRHFLPIVPLLLICATAAAERYATNRHRLYALSAAVVLTLGLQISIQGLFSINALRFMVTSEDRQAYLNRTILHYGLVPWVNSNLKDTDRLFLNDRQLFYFLEKPYFFGSPFAQALIDVSDQMTDPRTLHQQLSAQGITHLALMRGETAGRQKYPHPFSLLEEEGCLEVKQAFNLSRFGSRTLSTLSTSTAVIHIVGLKDSSCLG